MTAAIIERESVATDFTGHDENDVITGIGRVNQAGVLFAALVNDNETVTVSIDHEHSATLDAETFTQLVDFIATSQHALETNQASGELSCDFLGASGTALTVQLFESDDELDEIVVNVAIADGAAFNLSERGTLIMNLNLMALTAL